MGLSSGEMLALIRSEKMLISIPGVWRWNHSLVAFMLDCGDPSSFFTFFRIWFLMKLKSANHAQSAWDISFSVKAACSNSSRLIGAMQIGRSLSSASTTWLIEAYDRTSWHHSSILLSFFRIWTLYVYIPPIQLIQGLHLARPWPVVFGPCVLIHDRE